MSKIGMSFSESDLNSCHVNLRTHKFKANPTLPSRDFHSGDSGYSNEMCSETLESSNANEFWKRIGPIYNAVMTECILSDSDIENDIAPTSGSESCEPDVIDFKQNEAECTDFSLSSIQTNIELDPCEQDIKNGVSDFEEWLTQKETFIKQELMTVNDELSQSTLEDAFSFHMETQSEIQCYYKIVSALNRAALQASDRESQSNLNLTQKITNLKLKWKELFLKSLEVQFVLEHKLTILADYPQLGSDVDHKPHLSKYSLSRTSSFSSFNDIIPFDPSEYQSISLDTYSKTLYWRSKSLRLMTPTKFRDTRRCMSLDNFEENKLRNGHKSQREQRKLRFKTVRLSIPVPLQSTAVNYDGSEEDSSYSNESIASRTRRRVSTKSMSMKRNDRRISTTPESSDLETIQNLIENSHLQLNSLEERISTFSSQSTDTIATCQLNVRYLEDVKTGLLNAHQDSRLNGKLDEMNELIKFWRNLQERLEGYQSSTNGLLEMDNIEQIPDKNLNLLDNVNNIKVTSSKPHFILPNGSSSSSSSQNFDSFQAVKQRSSTRYINHDCFPIDDMEINDHSYNYPDEINEMDSSKRSYEVVDEFQQVQCCLHDLSNEFINIERMLTDCESCLRGFENEMSCKELTNNQMLTIYQNIQVQVENLKRMDGINEQIVFMFKELDTVFTQNNCFDDRLKRIQYRKQLLKEWCIDLLRSSDVQFDHKLCFQCTLCSEVLKNSDGSDPCKPIQCCTSIQQRRLHYIRKFWSHRSQEDNTYNENTSQFSSITSRSDVSTKAVADKPKRSNAITQYDYKISESQKIEPIEWSRRWILFIFLLCFIMLYICYYYMKDCSKIYHNHWKEMFYPANIPIC